MTREETIPEDGVYPTVADTLCEAGFECSDELKQWYYCAQFGPSISDRADILAIQQDLVQRFGADAFKLLIERDDEAGTTTAVHLLIEPSSDISVRVWELLEIIDSGERVDDEVYSVLADKIIRTAWMKASMSERVRLAEEAGAPPGCVLGNEVCDEVHTLMYRELEP